MTWVAILVRDGFADAFGPFASYEAACAWVEGRPDVDLDHFVISEVHPAR